MMLGMEVEGSGDQPIKRQLALSIFSLQAHFKAAMLLLL
jgi:hypothetical protein